MKKNLSVALLVQHQHMNHIFQNLIILFIIPLSNQQHNIQKFGKYVIFKDFIKYHRVGVM